MLKFATFIALLLLPVSQVSAVQDIVTSANDKRQYQSFTLDNQLQVLLISDPLTDKAAVSLDLDVGSASNPLSRPGLAHFLEHMLFLGTEKYPEAGEYQAFIQSHGGSHNAFTAQNNTNYYFDIAEDSIEPALDRFAQFFIAPLFAEKYTERERNAVHSEYQAKLKDDGRRNYAAFKQIMNPAHPGSRFAVGSLQTLSDRPGASIRDDLLAFYHQYYSANRMTLVVLGKSPLSKLKVLVEEKFSAIENRGVTKPETTIKRFSEGTLPLLLEVQSIKDIRQLTLSFPMPPAKSHWRTKPLYAISSLVGYEGQGSLLALLKKEGYANGLSAASSNDSALESTFQTSISLTPLGLENIDRVTELFFDFISQLKKQGISEVIHNEERRLAEQAFEFLPRQSPSSYVVWLSQVMRDYPMQNWLNAGYLLESYQPTLIGSYLNEITPDNMLMNIQAQAISGDKLERHYQTAYKVSQFSPERLQKWRNPTRHPSLAVRAENPYIADDLSLQPQPKPAQSQPAQISLSDGVKLWHQQDSEFNTPKADLFFTLLMPQLKLSVEQRISLSLYSQLLNDKFNETLYDASSAGISVSLYAHSRGLSVRISGYNDKQALIIDQLNNLGAIRFNQERFDILKENYRKGLKNSLKDQPYNQLIAELYQILGDSASVEKKLAELDQITLDNIYQLAQNYLASGELRILSHGNIDQTQATILAQKIADALQVTTPKDVSKKTPFLDLPADTQLHLGRSIENTNSALLLYFQGADSSYQARAASAILAEMSSSDYYTQLRTEQQLGYIVFSSSMSVRRHPGLVFVVQSPTASPETIMQSNREFLSGFSQKLEALNTPDLDKFKRSVVSRITEQERSTKQRSERYWREIDLSNGEFGDREALLDAVKALSAEQLYTQWQKMQARQIQLDSFASQLNVAEPQVQNEAAYREIKALRKRS